MITVPCLLLIFSVMALAGESLPDETNPLMLDFDTAVRIALEKNPNLAAVKARVNQAREMVTQAKSAWWPRLDAEAGATRADLSKDDYNEALLMAKLLSPYAEVDDPVSQYKGSLTLSWILFNGFERRYTILAAEFGEKEAVSGHGETLRLLISAVAEAYFSAQLARESISIAEADKAFYEKVLKDAQARYDVGAGALSDVLNFKVQINTSESSLLTAQENYETAISGLMAVLGMNGNRFPEKWSIPGLIQETKAEMELPNPDYGLAMHKRPDVKQSGFALERARAEAEKAKSNLYPDVSVYASFQGTRSDDPEFEADNFGNVVGLTVTYNLFDGGYKRAKIREAKERVVQSEKEMDSVKLASAADIRNAVIKVGSAQKKLVLERRNAILVMENRDLTEKEYAAGQTSLVNLNEAQRNFVIAESRKILALVSLRLAWKNYDTATADSIGGYEKF